MYVDAQMEALVGRLPPVADPAWKGATPEQIAEIEQIASGNLPDFYRWFLAKMGGTLDSPREDFRASTVIATYRQGIVQPDPRYLLIGRNPDPVMPRLFFYDLEERCRDDARLLSRPEDGPPWEAEAETFREHLAWGLVLIHRVMSHPQRCEGSLTNDGGTVFEHLDQLMHRFGFTTPIDTGAFCGVYERDDAAMTCMSAVKDSNLGLQFFRLGGPDAGSIRRILGEIATATPLEVRITGWSPPLPSP